MLLDIRPDHLQIVQTILRQHVPNCPVWAFGSRAKWTAKDHSDLDLCIVSDKPLDFRLLGALTESFSDSDLPYMVDIVDWATTSESFRKIIARDKVVVQEAGRGKGGGMNAEFQTTTLGKLVNFSNGRSSPERFDDGKYSVFGSNGLIGKANETNAPPNSIVVGRVGSYCGSVHFSPQPCWITDNAIKAIAKDRNDTLFLFYLLKHLDLNNWRSGSGQPLINQATLNAIEVCVPEPFEQKEIGQFVGALDDRITLLRETNATLEAIAQALFKSWFVDFDPVRAKLEGRAPEGMDEATARLFPDSFEESELGLVPRGWRVGTVGAFARQHKGSINPLQNPGVMYEHFSLPAFDNQQMPVSELGTEIKSNKTSVPPDAVLLSKLNPHIPRIWLPVDVGNHAVCSTEFLVFVPTPGSGASKEFIYCAFTTAKFKELLCQLVTGTSNSHQRVKPEGVSTMIAVIPSEVTLKGFASFAKPIFERIGHNRKKAQTLATLRDTLLPRLISGALRLPEAQAAAEEALA